ncbi:hypothetical protein [Aquimarina sp. 2201CG5-10]|uniref:hypothetical protein n=1 Tax=Aquimarina callyspongiae TaxID=3098150 RepID=UPI002AB5BB52|nr:hypothetical protein [Aquimarina sp. 2201CG5-10]MDY8135358.1 hypothetical protein [Aquimarina sp. 2201CG5-10]
MKKILNLTGVEKLSREEQSQIKGSRAWISCCPTGRGCQISFPGGSFCEPGYCDPYRPGRCILY